MAVGREAVLASAAELFCERGINATGIDAIIDHAGVAKMTLYNNFGSKAELVAEYLRLRDERWWARLAEACAGVDDPRQRLLVWFDAYRDGVAADDHRGCVFLNGAAELTDPEHPASEVIRSHKATIRDRLRELAVEAGAADPDALAWHLALLLDGAAAEVNVVKSDEPFAHARVAATHLLELALGSP